MPTFASKIFFIDRVANSKFIQNIAVMFAGNVMAQVAAFLAAPIITRLYLPEDFGVMSFIQAIAGTIGVITCFCYQQAIVIPKSDEKAYNLSLLSLSATLLTVCSLFPIIFFTDDFIADFGGISQYKNCLYFIPFLVLFIGLKEICVYLYTRFKLFNKLSIAIAIIPIFTALAKITAGYLLEASPFWLITGNTIGVAVAVVYLIINFKFKIPLIIRSIKISSLKIVAKEYYKFPRYSLPGTFFDTLTNNLPVILFAAFYSPAIVGLFGFTNMVLQRPVSVVSQSISNILFQKFSEIINKEQELYFILKKTTVGLFLLGIVPFGILTCTGKLIFSFIFGNEWMEAGVYAQILSPMIFLFLINKPAGRVIVAKQKLKFGMYYAMANNLFRVVAIIAGYYIFHSAFSSIILLSITGILMNIIFIGYAFVISKK